MTMSRDRHYRQRHPGSLRRGSAYAGSSWLVTVVVTLCAACGEDPPPPPQAGQAKAAAAAENPGKPTDPQAGPASANAAQETPGGDAGQAAAGDTTGAEPPAAPKDTGNAWQLPSRPADVNNGDRVYVLTRGRDRTYTDPAAVYQLYAYDVAAVHGEKVTLQELGGGRFTVSGLFVIPSGAKLKSLRKGDMVLAEWASSLKHAIITGFDGDKVTVRYTDLPESWAEEKVTATRDARELTQQEEGFAAGNFAIAESGDGKELVMLVAKSDETWLVRKFTGRVSALHRTKLTPIPLKPKIRRRQKVLVPWIGLMYPGKVTKVVGARVLVKVDGIGQKQPITVPLGQVIPLSR